MRVARPAFTMADLLVALAALAICGAAGVGSIYKARETANRIKCASNLRQIGQAMLLYANENNNQYPRTRYDPADPAARVYTAPASPNPFAANGPGPNDVTAAMFLLLRTQDITPAVFICPTDTGAEKWDFGGQAKTAQNWSNFDGRPHLSFSMTNPYFSPAAVKAGAMWSEPPAGPPGMLTSDFAVAADINPGGAALLQLSLDSPSQQMRAGNSPNHAGDGQNVLYGDGHVSFSQTSFCGVRLDNIYTAASAGGPSLEGSVAGPNDSFLLPTATAGPLPPLTPPLRQALAWVLPVGALLVAVLVAALIWWSLRTRSTPAPG